MDNIFEFWGIEITPGDAVDALCQNVLALLLAARVRLGARTKDCSPAASLRRFSLIKVRGQVELSTDWNCPHDGASSPPPRAAAPAPLCAAAAPARRGCADPEKSHQDPALLGPAGGNPGADVRETLCGSDERVSSRAAARAAGQTQPHVPEHREVPEQQQEPPPGQPAQRVPLGLQVSAGVHRCLHHGNFVSKGILKTSPKCLYAIYLRFNSTKWEV